MPEILKAEILYEVDDFRLRVNFGVGRETTGLFGPSGCGKSTLIKCLSGLLQPLSSTVYLNDKLVSDSKRNFHLPAHKRNIGVVFQHGHLFPHLSVEKNLKYGMKRKQDQNRFTFDCVVKMLGISPLLSRLPDGLSGGERQLVALGRALLASPDFLLLDEPLSAVDAARKEELLPRMHFMLLQAAIPSIYVSHDLDELKRVSGRILYMENGSIVSDPKLICKNEKRSIFAG